MKTVSYSLDDETVKGIADLARKTKSSRSDVVRSMFARVVLEKTLEEIELESAPLLNKLGLQSEDEIAYYSKSKSKNIRNTKK